MADDAQVSIQATILPDEIAKTLTGTMTVTPADANDKWYYKLTACTTTSTDLIAGSFLDYTAVDDDTAPTAVHANDLVKFLFVQNTSSADGVYIVFDGGTAANDGGSGFWKSSPYVSPWSGQRRQSNFLARKTQGRSYTRKGWGNQGIHCFNEFTKGQYSYNYADSG